MLRGKTPYAHANPTPSRGELDGIVQEMIDSTP